MYAQQYYFKNYSAENGLPFVQIYSLCQDSKGYLWSGGYGGLSKFNGKEFKNYTPKNGLANHFVTAIIEDNQHQIIVGTIDGISVISNEKIKIIGKTNGLKNTTITSFAKDKSGKIYIGTNGGLYQLDNDKVSEIHSLGSKQITCILTGSKECLWIGTTEGLFCLKNNQLQFQEGLNSIENKEITCLSENPKTNEIAIGTKKGITIINLKNQHLINLNSNNGLLDEHILSLQYSPEGELWIGTKSGLMNYSENGMSYFTIRDENNSNHIRSLLFDIENNLWIGTHSGLYKYRDKGFTVYGKNEGLGSAFIYQITDDKQGNLWIGSEHNGIFKYENGIFKNFSEKNGLADNQAQSAFVSEDGIVYVGTEKGISIIENNQIISLKQKTGIEINTPIYAIYIDKKNRLWYGTKNGLGYVQKVNNTYTEIKMKLPTSVLNYEVWSIKEDLKGNLWIGTYLSGLYKYVNETIIPIELPISQKIESVLDIEFDSRNNLYAATLSGVLKYEPTSNKAQLVTEQEGLSSDLVYSVKITKDYKTIWAGTNQGVSKINLEKLNSSIFDITRYNKSDGFEGVECNTHGIFEDQKGNVWFGTVNGLVKYTPQNFKRNEQFSATNFTGFKLGYQDTILKSGVKLPYYLNTISFNYDGISFTNPDKVRYSYKLEGYDKTWSPNTELNFAKYNNLPAGKYSFKVKSCNSEGLWNIEPIEFNFEIASAFYKTWWFISILFFTALAGVLLIFKLRFDQLSKKEKEKFEQQVEVSKAELKALRAQMNPHFVFNSLNSIQHYILNSKGEEAVKYLSKFAKLIRTILNNSDKPTVTINEDLQSLKLYLELEKMRFDNKFDYTILISDDLDGDYDEIPPMLIQPYIENSILHGINPKEGNGHIDIQISTFNKYIKISIIDDGIGREKSKAMKSIKPNGNHKSMAMKITKDRLKILNTINESTLNVYVSDLYDEQKKPIGTQVDLYIPYIK
jgi:ligand-binding sensor domain-containing protein